MGNHPKCIIYCRVSDTKQKTEGSGLESQEFRCRQYAAEKNYVVERVFHDDVSGGGDYTKRPGMIALLNFLEAHQKENYLVVFDDLKRLARDTMFHWQLRHAMSNFGARLECLNYQFDDSPEGEFMETLFAAQGQLERKQIGRQTRQKTQARLEAGYYAFVAPAGFKYIKTKDRGKVLVRDEPAASIIAEAMEGFACGRFQTMQEVRYFLEHAPEFPSNKMGNNTPKKMLSNPLYAGMIVYEPWGVTMRKGQHEGMISYESFCKIQERISGRAYAPTRKDLNKDFPLRGAVACECGNSLTAAWSKSRTGKRHPYYLCQNRKCEHKGRSIRRDLLEGEFENLLRKLEPSKPLVKVAEKMFRRSWAAREQSVLSRQAMLNQQGQRIGQEIEQLLDRIVETQSDTVSRALEKRIEGLEAEKLALEEKRDACTQSSRSFDEMYRTAMAFLAKPQKIWACGGFAEKRAVLKLAFTKPLIWDRKGMYRTPNYALPFKVLGDFMMQDFKMVPEGRIELPTRGFSIPCSTTELLGHMRCFITGIGLIR